MPITNRTSCTHRCSPADQTPPPTPCVRTAVSFGLVKALRERSSCAEGIVSHKPGSGYMEFGNVEPGTTIELINLSKDPEAEFSCADITKLKITGRDVDGRRASVYLTPAQMKKIDLKAGDQFRVRVVDANGNVSGVVAGEIEPDDWADRQVQSFSPRCGWYGKASRGGKFRLLDGENQCKTVLVRALCDHRQPIVLADKLELAATSFSGAQQLAAQVLLDAEDELLHHSGKDSWTRDEILEMASVAALPVAVRKALVRVGKKAASFDQFDAGKDADGKVSIADLGAIASGIQEVTLKADHAIEPHSRIEVFNTRTGDTHRQDIGADQKICLDLPGTADGDTLIVRSFDNEGVAGKEVELRFAAACDNGRAQTMSILGARLPGVI